MLYEMIKQILLSDDEISTLSEKTCRDNIALAAKKFTGRKLRLLMLATMLILAAEAEGGR